MQRQSEPFWLSSSLSHLPKRRRVQIRASEQFRNGLPCTPDRQSSGESRLNEKKCSCEETVPGKPICFLGFALIRIRPWTRMRVRPEAAIICR